MANLIIARDLQSKTFATINEDWLTRFPGEFEKVRDVLDPISEEELAEAKSETKAAADQRKVEIAEATKAAEAAAKTAAETGEGDASGSAGRNRF